jgi:hypothetical protein
MPTSAASPAGGAKIEDADAVIVGSYVPKAWRSAAGSRRSRPAPPPFTTSTRRHPAKLARGDHEYLSPESHSPDTTSICPSPAGRRSILERSYGAPAARRVYCSVDPGAYRPLACPHRLDVPDLGTYSPDRQPTLESLLLAPRPPRPDLRFVSPGPQYPGDIEWPAKVERIERLPAHDHAPSTRPRASP